MRTRGSGVEPAGEILRFVGHQSFAEFHDAHGEGWYAVIGKYEFSDPEIPAADNSPDRETLLAWLDGSALLNVVPAADALARLRIIEHGVLAVDFMFGLEIARVRSLPMALQRQPHGSIIHLDLPPTPCCSTSFRVSSPRPHAPTALARKGRAFRAEMGFVSGQRVLGRRGAHPPGVLDHGRTSPQSDVGARPALARGPIGRHGQLEVFDLRQVLEDVLPARIP